MSIVEKFARLADQCVVQGVAEALSRSPYAALRTLSCSVTHGIVTLQGRLPSFYLRQIAQSLALGVEGVREVRSEIEVTD
jgi:osmotically-inducible protein OsmY